MHFLKVGRFVKVTLKTHKPPNSFISCYGVKKVYKLVTVKEGLCCISYSSLIYSTIVGKTNETNGRVSLMIAGDKLLIDVGSLTFKSSCCE